MVNIELIKTPDSEYPYYAVQIKDKYLMSKNVRQGIINLPAKLPMICPPKAYGPNTLGGYLLNDEKFSDGLLVEKKAYALTSELSQENKVYSLVNNISSIPFKINTDLLDYIKGKGAKHDLLIDPYTKHKFEDIEKKTRYQQSVYASHNSKVVLQETILDIAEFYRKFSKIYFPVRLDQRGRLYCTPSYLNYQSNELSKSLLLFAEPGVINKNNTQSVIYLKAYGANCYGGSISKQSMKVKLD